MRTLYKVVTFSQDNKDNKSARKEIFFDNQDKAQSFARQGRPNTDDVGGFWSDEFENTLAAFDETGETGDKITMYAIVTEIEVES